MFSKKTDIPAENLDKVIITHLAAMSDMGPTHTEYPAMVQNLDTLYSLRNASAPKPMSADVKATIAANLAGIVLILTHERVGVITTKALGFVQKLR